MNTFDEYQEAVVTTAIYPERENGDLSDDGGVGGWGRVANQVKKILRDDNSSITDVRREAIRKEIGGVMWYVAALCTDLDLNLGDVCRENIAILASRRERGTLTGDGDNR